MLDRIAIVALHRDRNRLLQTFFAGGGDCCSRAGIRTQVNADNSVPAPKRPYLLAQTVSCSFTVNSGPKVFDVLNYAMFTQLWLIDVNSQIMPSIAIYGEPIR